MGGRRWDVLGATVVALALVTAGCGSGGGGEAAPPPTTGASSTTTAPAPDTPVVTDEEAVLAAYQGYWAAVLAAGNPPDPGHPDLPRVAVGPALDHLRSALAQQREVGQLVRLPDNSISSHAAEVESVAGDAAIVLDCSVDDGLLVDWGSGRVLNDAVVTWTYRSTVVRTDDAWRVESVDVITKREGAAPCAG